MTAPRLPFLWPVLFRSSNVARSAPRLKPRKAYSSRNLVTSTRREREAQRYGTAHDPAAHVREKEAPNEMDGKMKHESTKGTEKDVEDGERDESIPTTSPDAPPQSAPAPDFAPLTAPPEPPRAPDAKPLDTVLHMPSPEEEEERKPPHLKTPPYVHHFDSYSLVKQLAKGNFTPEQSVVIMKAVRGILTDNMELARKSLVSKSNVENESYLFRAACSELRTELGNSRKGEVEKMRSERNQLQHEVDILNQKLGQETGHLRDELKGLFDDRKMAVRQEQRAMESKTQELNYKITVALNSDARSEVEGLRWVLTRRAAITIGFAAFMLFVGLRYSSYVAHTQQEEKKKAKENTPPPNEGQDNPPSTSTPLIDQEPVGGDLLATRGGISYG